MKVVERTLDSLIPYARNPRKNDDAVDSLAAIIKEVGFRVPMVIDSEGVIVTGHTRLKAAKKLGMKTVPCIIADDLTPQQIKAFRLLDNKVSEKADWDVELLALELEELKIDPSAFDVTFDLPQGPQILEGAGEPTDGLERFEQISFVLTADQAELVRRAVDSVELSGFSENTNRKGNALAQICEEYLGGQS